MSILSLVLLARQRPRLDAGVVAPGSGPAPRTSRRARQTSADVARTAGSHAPTLRR
jgi:hypothetical protein